MNMVIDRFIFENNLTDLFLIYLHTRKRSIGFLKIGVCFAQ